MKQMVTWLLILSLLGLCACGGAQAGSGQQNGLETVRSENSQAMLSKAEETRAHKADTSEVPLAAQAEQTGRVKKVLAAARPDKSFRPSLAQQRPNLSADLFEHYAFEMLSEAAKAKLALNGFVVLPGWNEEFFSSYEMNRYAGVPNFVTTDALLHSYHLFFSRLLKQIEREQLSQQLEKLILSVFEQSRAQAERLKGTVWEKAARRNMIYCAVPLSLLQDKIWEGLPEDLAELCRQEFDLIQAAGGIEASPLLNAFDEPEPVKLEDYSQYKPRSYYAANEQLSRYFRAMMWCGRMPFLKSSELGNRSALLLCLTLNEAQMSEICQQVQSVLNFFIGESDDPTPDVYSALLRKVYGTEQPDLSRLREDEKAWQSWQEQVRSLKLSRILSMPVYEFDSDEEVEARSEGLRLFGQRVVYDAEVFQRLLYRAVKENARGEKRLLPMALDIPAAMGSERAAALLKERGQMDYEHYEHNLQQLQKVMRESGEEFLKNGSLYGSWLYTLQPLTEQKGEGYPYFMTTKAWQDKSLSSFLGSWAELKHDSILYAKQVYAEMGGVGLAELDDRGYVEPEPRVFGRLADLAERTRSGLLSGKYLAEEKLEGLKLFAELSRRLETMAIKELEAQELDDEDYELIRTIGGQLEHLFYLAMSAEGDNAVVSASEHPSAIIADVATDPNGQVLEVGTGRVDDLLVIFSIDGKPRLGRGGVYSFYSFPQTLEDRLSDEQWRQRLGIVFSVNPDGSLMERAEPVERPDWVYSFLLRE